MENAETHDRSPDTHPLGDPEQLPLKHADSSNSIPLPPPPLPPVASSESDDLSSPQDDLPEPAAAAEEVQEDFHVPEPAPEPEPDHHQPVFETDADYREGSPSFAADEQRHHHHHHYPLPHPQYDPYQPAALVDDGMEHPADPTQRLSQEDGGEREGGSGGSGVEGGIGGVGVGSQAQAAGRSSSSDGGSSTEVRMEYDMGQPYHHQQQQQPPEEGGGRHQGSGSLDHLPPGDPIPLTEHTGPKYGTGGGGGAGGGEDHANQKTNAQVVTAVEEKEVRGENCCEKFLRCLSYVPCGSLIAWIILLLGLGALAGSLIVGTRKARNMLEDEGLLWFMEFSVTGVVVGMFVLGSGFLVAGHLSTDPTSRRVFNSSSKNNCARGFNIFLLVFVYVLCLLWILLSSLLATPIVLLVMMYLVTGTFGESDCLRLENYGFSTREICASGLDRFKDEAKDVLICYGVSLLSSWLVAVSLIHFLICISANITHLRDNRFATLSAYETEEIRNSKGSVLDTNM